MPRINPVLRFAGIIGTLTNAGPQLPNVNKEVADLAEAQTSNELEGSIVERPLFIREAVMQRSAPLAVAAQSGIAYWQAPATQPIFKAIADAIRPRLGKRTT